MPKRYSWDRSEVHYTLVVIGPFENRWVCHYCGCPADTVDHIPPISRYHDASCLDPEVKPVKVPACRECNCIAADILHLSFVDRQDYVKRKLERKYAKQLAFPDWSDDELEDMSDEMVRSIKHNMAARAFVLSRINFHPK